MAKHFLKSLIRSKHIDTYKFLSKIKYAESYECIEWDKSVFIVYKHLMNQNYPKEYVIKDARITKRLINLLLLHNLDLISYGHTEEEAWKNALDGQITEIELLSFVQANSL